MLCALEIYSTLVCTLPDAYTSLASRCTTTRHTRRWTNLCTPGMLVSFFREAIGAYIYDPNVGFQEDTPYQLLPVSEHQPTDLDHKVPAFTIGWFGGHGEDLHTDIVVFPLRRTVLTPPNATAC